MDKMMIFIGITGAVLAVAAMIVTIIQHKKHRRLMNRLDDMIEAAVNGEFTEKNFDESMLSALENRLAVYLESAETSAMKTALEKDKIKTMIADISHQTKTPIANIMLYSELLCESGLSGEDRENLDALRMQTEKLSFLISSLVKLSRLETGIISLKPVIGSVEDLIVKTAAVYREKAQAKGILLSVKRGGESMADKAALAVFDEKWTIEALGNIVDNAIKYTENGSVNISVKPYEMFVAIEVADTGIGIAEEEISNIFQRFYRGEENKNQEGVGIGLYLARKIISEQGGYIKVTSKKDRGSVFSVFLPSSAADL